VAVARFAGLKRQAIPAGTRGRGIFDDTSGHDDHHCSQGQETAVKRPANIFGDCPELKSAKA